MVRQSVHKTAGITEIVLATNIASVMMDGEVLVVTSIYVVEVWDVVKTAFVMEMQLQIHTVNVIQDSLVNVVET